MKKLIIAVALMALFIGSAHAADVTATFGDRNSSGLYRVQADTDGAVTFASDTSIVSPYSNVTSTTVAQTLAATDSGKVITSAGNGGHKFTLPRAAVGLSFTISSGVKQYITVDTVDSSDTILYSISGTSLDAGDSIKSTGEAGDTVTVCSTAANKWSICGIRGSWTDNGTN